MWRQVWRRKNARCWAYLLWYEGSWSYWCSERLSEGSVHIHPKLMKIFIHSMGLQRLQAANPTIFMVLTLCFSFQSSLQYVNFHICVNVEVSMKMLCKFTISRSFSAVIPMFRHSFLQHFPRVTNIEHIAFLTSYCIDEVAGSTCSEVPDGRFGILFLVIHDVCGRRYLFANHAVLTTVCCTYLRIPLRLDIASNQMVPQGFWSSKGNWWVCWKSFWVD